MCMSTVKPFELLSLGLIHGIKEALRNGMNNIYIATCSDTSSSFNNTTFLNVSPEFRKEVSNYLNNRLVELAKEVQILQGVTPIEYKENEDK